MCDDYILEMVTKVADNHPTEHLYRRLTFAACQAIEDGDVGTGATPDDYRDAYAGRSGRYDRSDYAAVVGIAVRDALREYVESSLPSGHVVAVMLAEMLDYGNRELWTMFGEHYMPDPDEVFPDDTDPDDAD